MTTPRINHTATLLFNGKVLITGGFAVGQDRSKPNSYFSIILTSAELYDPITGTFTATGNMTTGRSNSATLLPDGRVLIAGGSLAELYDPSTGTFTPTGSMVTAHGGHHATLLNNGKVLISGGLNDCPDYSIAGPELYDPATGTFTATGDYAEKDCTGTGLARAPATLLPNGKVLIAAEPTAELYDPGTGTFSLTGQVTRVPPPTYISGRTATLLTNGKVLLAGGENEDFAVASAELYDPSTGMFTAIGNMTRRRAHHTATLLQGGTVLIAGSQGTIESSELYDPATATFAATEDMTTPRFQYTATLLMDGRILMAGGYTSGPIGMNFTNSHSAELYVPSVLVPAQVVTGLRFDQPSVLAGSSYSVNVSGSNLTPETFFDVRFTSPGSNTSSVVLNWQRGPAASHDVPAGTAAGIWTINGVRAHQVETDHTGSFFPVSATITVSR